MQRPVAKDRPCFDTLKNLLPQEGESPVHLHQAGQITILGFSAKFRRLQKCDCRPLTSKVAQELYNLISKVSSLIYTAKSSIFYYSLMQKNGYTFAIVHSSKCVSVFLHQTILQSYTENVYWGLWIVCRFFSAVQVYGKGL